MSGDAIAEEICTAASRIMAEVSRRREEYVRAWFAETGLKPSESMLVHQAMPDGSFRMWVEHRPAVHDGDGTEDV